MSGECIDGPLHEKSSVELLKFINKYVTANLIKDYSLTGFVQCIDPVSGCITLQQLKEEKFKTILIPGHAIISLTITESSLEPPKLIKNTVKTEEDINLRKNKIIECLKNNLLPVQDSDGVLMCGSIEIVSPYTLTDIYTDNFMVYSQICGLIKKIEF